MKSAGHIPTAHILCSAHPSLINYQYTGYDILFNNLNNYKNSKIIEYFSNSQGKKKNHK